jgi:hypothetical protein
MFPTRVVGALLIVVAALASWLPAAGAAERVYDDGVWWIQTNDGPPVQQPMAVFVDGVARGTTHLLQIGHRSPAGASGGWPEAAALYNTGYLRLTPPGLPYGNSFVLGVAYWDSAETYAHNVQISRVDVDTSAAASTGVLHLTVQAREYQAGRWPDYRLDLSYDLALAAPTTSATTMAVVQRYTVRAPFALSSARRDGDEAFKVVQFSCMYIDDYQHDCDGAQYVDAGGVERLVSFDGFGCDRRIFATPRPLSAAYPWLQLRHGDDAGWQGNTPNAIVRVDDADAVARLRPQGYLTCSSDRNADNLGAWLADAGAPASFSAGQVGTHRYTLIAQDDPLARRLYLPTAPRDR